MVERKRNGKEWKIRWVEKMSETINFSEPSDRWGTVGWIQKEDWDSQDSSPRPTKLRRTIYRFIASPTVIVFPWNEIGWKIPRGSERRKKIHREEEAKLRRDVGPRETTFATWCYLLHFSSLKKWHLIHTRWWKSVRSFLTPVPWILLDI